MRQLRSTCSWFGLAAAGLAAVIVGISPVGADSSDKPVTRGADVGLHAARGTAQDAAVPASAPAAAVSAVARAGLETAAEPWRHCLAQLPTTGLGRDACDGRFESFLKAIPSGDLAAAQQAFEVVRDATVQQGSDDKKYWAVQLKSGLGIVPEALSAYLAELGVGTAVGRVPQPASSLKSSPVAAKAAASAARAMLLNVEGEDLAKAGKILLAGGQVTAQPMAGFGAGWSGGGQLFWSGGSVGAVLDLLVDVPAAATYAVELYLTRAPDYGQVKIQVDGKDVPFTVDGYAPRVLAPTPRQIGKFSLGQGQRKVSFMIVGKNPQATGYLVGIDRIRLYSVGVP